jgi:dihydrodipicolinate synthase/N-acetylneuraminate lyase
MKKLMDLFNPESPAETTPKNMEPVNRMKGIIAVLNTPFTSENQIDTTSIRRYVNQALKNGVVGFLVLGKAAEVHKLSRDEQILIARTVVEEVNNSVPVIAGAISDRQAERLRLAGQLLECGCQGIMIHLPFEISSMFEEYVQEFDRLNPPFLMIQDLDFYGYGIPVDLIAKLFHTIKSFKCLKIEVIPAGLKYSQVAAATEGRLHLSGGWAAAQMIEALDRGVHAFMPSVLHNLYGKIFQLHHEGQRDRASFLFHELVPVLAFSHQHLDISIHFNKHLLQRQGIFGQTIVRQPSLPFDNHHKVITEEMISRAMILSQHLESY